METQIYAAIDVMKNPLLDIDLRNSIHHSTNKHCQLHRGFFDYSYYDNYKLDYFHQFLLGVLISIQSSPNDDLVGIYIRKYIVQGDSHGFRFFAIFKDSIVLHDIVDEKLILGVESRMMSKQEYLSFEQLIKDRHDLSIDKLNIKSILYDAGAQQGRLLQMNIKRELNMVEVQDTGIRRIEYMFVNENDSPLDLERQVNDVKFTYIEGHERSFNMFRSAENRKQWLSANLRESVIDANYIFKSLNKNGLSLFQQEARACFMHGLFSAAMPDNYYTEALRFTFQHQSHLPKFPWSHISIPPMNPGNPQYTIIDFGSAKEFYYSLASSVRTDAEIHLLQPSTDWGGKPILQDEMIKWDSANLITNFVDEIKSFWSHGNLQLLKAKRDVYLNLLAARKLEHDKYGRMTTTDLYKYFLLGELRTSLSGKFYINDQNGLDAILIDHGKTKILLSFNADHWMNVDLQHMVSKSHTEVTALNFSPSGPSLYTITLSNALRKYGGFQPIWTRNLNEIFTEISFNDKFESKLHTGIKFRIFMDDLLRDVRNFAADLPAINAYFCGIFSKSAVLEWSHGQHERGSLSSIAIKTIRNLHFNFHLFLFDDASKQTTTEAYRLLTQKPILSDAFHIAYNFATRKNRMAVAAVEKRSDKLELSRPFSTLDVVNQCLNQPKRRKRVSATAVVCPVVKSQKKDRTTSFEELEKRFAKYHPQVHKQISKIYKISTRIQAAIIGKTMLNHLFQGDYAAFGVDIAFLGLAVTSPYAAEQIGRWGEKKTAQIVERASKSKGLFQSVIKKIGWKIATVGRCLPTLGFTAFSAYQLHHEIKNNDTTSAILTGTSLAIDIVSCGFEAAAAVGLLAISPVIVKVGAIISTALAVVQNVYSGFREVEKISEVVPLSFGERYYSFKRSLIPWLNADPTLQSIAEQVLANEQAIAVTFHMFPNAKRFLISAALKIDEGTGELSYVDDNTIHMTHKQKIQVSRAMPRKDHIGDQYEMFCSMNEKYIDGKKDLESKMDWSRIATFGLPEMIIAVINHVTRKEQPEILDYHCINAFGVKTVNSSVSDTTIFLLHNGTDTVSGFSDSPNVMILGNGKKSVSAGRKDDRFVMIGQYTYGYLDGGPGDDVIDFSDYAKDITTVMNFENLQISFSMLRHQPLTVKNIENFIGRKNLPDHIKVCNHTSIDLGGSDSAVGADDVKILQSENCSNGKLVVYLRNNTGILCEAEDADISYIVSSEASGTMNIPVGSHNFVFNLLSLTEVQAEREDQLLKLCVGSSGRLTINATDAAKVKFSFNAENIMIILNRGSLIAHMNSTISIYELIENYASYSRKNQLIELIAQTNHGRVKLSHNDSTIGNRDLNIVFLDADRTLVAHSDKQNYFLIRNESSDDMLDIPMNITIDASAARTLPCYIDLKYFCTAKNPKYDVRMVAMVDGSNIAIKILSVPVIDADGADDTEIGTVTVIDGISYMDQIRIHVWGESRLRYRKNVLFIQPIPIKVSKAEFTIHPDQFEFNTVISYDFEIEHLEAYSLNDTLILTNVGMLNDHKNNCVILTFMEYHHYLLKYDTLVLKFKNKAISLDHFRPKAVDESLLWQRMDERLSISEEEEKEELAFEEYRRMMDVVTNDSSLDSDSDI